MKTWWTSQRVHWCVSVNADAGVFVYVAACVRVCVCEGCVPSSSGAGHV